MSTFRNQLERYLIDTLIKSSDGGVADAAVFSHSDQQLALDQRLPIQLLKPLADEIKNIAQGYTNNREITIPQLSSNACRAYALYYTLINFEKIERLLSAHLPLLPTRPLKVLDYGCGPGTAAFALAAAHPDPFSLTAVDANPAMRQIAKTLLQPLTGIGKISTLKINPADASDSYPQAAYDLILAGHVFNEFAANEQQRLIGEFLRSLTPDGTLVIIESALQAQTREIMALRDFILDQDRTLEVAFPCTHRALCPMLKEPAQWCHGPLSWNPPHLIRQLDQLTGFNKHRIKYSAFIFTRNHAAIQQKRGEFRVVAPPSSSKRGDLLHLCGETFYGETLLSKRARAENNIEFRRADHFDCISAPVEHRITSMLDGTIPISRTRAP